MRKHRSSRGFSLVEVTLALGLAAFCLIALLALVPGGLSTNKGSIQKTVASGIASQVMSDLLASSSNATNSNSSTGSITSSIFKFSIPAAGGSESISPTSSPQTIFVGDDGVPTGAVGEAPVDNGTTVSLYRVTVGFKPPTSAQRAATLVRILVTWPALTDRDTSIWPDSATPVKYLGSLEIVTALDRN